MGAIEKRQRVHHQAVIDAHAAYLKAEGYSFSGIGREMGCSKQTAYDRVMRAYSRMAGPKAKELRQRELRDIDTLEMEAWEVLDATHIVVQHGRVVTVKATDPTSGLTVEIPIPDHGPKLDAIATILRCKDQRAKYEGLYAPVRHRVQMVTQSQLEADIEEMEQEFARYADQLGPLD